MPTLTRRAALAAGAMLPAATLVPASVARAGGHASGPVQPKARGIALGDMTATALLAGSAVREGDMQGTFGMNVSAEAFAEASRNAFIPTDAATFFFTPTVVQSGENTILFDTGLNAGGITAALEQAGIAPGDVTHVVITHMHGDHIGGLMNEGTPTFANAVYVTGQAEYDHWAANPNDGFTGNVQPLAEKMSFVGDGEEIAPGITAMDMSGHTPGHMGYMLSSGDKSLLITADMTNHYVWSLAHPDWEVRFDMDKEAAAATRRRVLGMVAAERIPMLGYHMPFPAMGYVEANGDGFRWIPESYQLML
ncbi:MBL fold metallo-hydrolase [Jannaschia seohaensis]|uniref:Glyoxylase, beta-lactamase superfamily II n=1 Tax=Jannaschia seohaensis TaxID=475081 RepID=A0A2Y9BXX1_9RHOB|nr:MBL fold metallo-hydrolase [Jannaschia seohaensis]PWJ21182.1 glyoxylase-like metal-dependent hydrolase (beta-lactamase superfamily II) [Jannaschia seohaensis]SSA41592.1 Glyoxylase, beta-lactamase superfamily II [Jannaschia seohaensis]